VTCHPIQKMEVASNPEQVFPAVDQQVRGQWAQVVLLKKCNDIKLVPLTPPLFQQLAGTGLKHPARAETLLKEGLHDRLSHPPQDIVQAIEFRNQIKQVALGLVIKTSVPGHDLRIRVAVCQGPAAKHAIFSYEFSCIASKSGQVFEGFIIVQFPGLLLGKPQALP